MGLQVLWSLGLMCLDIYALRIERDIQNPVLVSLFVVGDWIELEEHYSILTSVVALRMLSTILLSSHWKGGICSCCNCRSAGDCNSITGRSMLFSRSDGFVYKRFGLLQITTPPPMQQVPNFDRFILRFLVSHGHIFLCYVLAPCLSLNGSLSPP
ncbi:hypothetical protein IFM89_003620 [Coptis chinensis]|uniref:Uncharacterized protein n=1 Tax=Coptis chinensis TaxID=261450 RepID=A0A835LDB8_9MAGN|nr:hypothetical protein IFM89_003620 [Coptis chinensis]